MNRVLDCLELRQLLDLSSEELGLNRDITHEEGFGSDFSSPRVGRREEIKNLWACIAHNTTGGFKSQKKSAYYIHTSPGLGKTFLLKELMKKRGSDIEDFEDVAHTTFIIPIDFNRNCCKQISQFLQKAPPLTYEFIPLARLYYIQFADQKALEWTHFIQKLLHVIKKKKKNVTESLLKNSMRSHIIAKAAGRHIAVLVDELIKSTDLGELYPDNFRSEICKWADGENPFCHIIIFSSLDRDLMKRELTVSNRSMISATTLPLLSMEDAKTLIDSFLLNSNFVDQRQVAVDKVSVVEILAAASGGHPRSIEKLIGQCHGLPHYCRNLKDILVDAGKELAGAYRPPPSWIRLISVALLAEPVRLEDMLTGDDGRNNETFESLVNRGLLLSSLNDSTTMITPSLPEIFLYWWCVDEEMAGYDEARKYLLHVLEHRRGFSRKKWESLHSNWQCLMRIVRPNSFHRVPFYQLYHLDEQSMENKSHSVFVHVDGKTKLENRNYVRNTIITVKANTIYRPDSETQPGWDTLIIFETFPQFRRSKPNVIYLLAVFEQNKYSKDNATNLSLKVIENAVDNCGKVFHKFLSLPPNCQWLPEKWKRSRNFPFYKNSPLDSFVVSFIAKTNPGAHAISHSPRNAITLFHNDLRSLYGPTISKFIDSLVPDQDIYVSSLRTIAK
jgi:hypothetical protein